MTTQVTLELNEVSHRRVVEVLRGAHLDVIADDIEAQLPKPVPPEPQGDYLAREPSGWVSEPVSGHPGVLKRQHDGARLYWDTLWRYHGADLAVYRPDPSFARRLLGGEPS